MSPGSLYSHFDSCPRRLRVWTSSFSSSSSSHPDAKTRNCLPPPPTPPLPQASGSGCGSSEVLYQHQNHQRLLTRRHRRCCCRHHHHHSRRRRYSPASGPAATWRPADGDLNTPDEIGPGAPACSCCGGGSSSSSSSSTCSFCCARGSVENLLSGWPSGSPGLAGGEDNSCRSDDGGGAAVATAGAGVWYSRNNSSSKRPSGTLSTVLVLTLLTASTCSAAVPNEIHTGTGMKAEPQFGESIQNVTVAAGREATLSCIVDDLGSFRVGWLKVDSQTILSLQKRVVTHNTRISVTHDEHRTWNLHIRQVKESDSGCYMCQINTPVMKNQIGCIKVHVPPDIINGKTSSDTTINEGDTVHLRCVAEGLPTPEVKWKREDGRGIIIKSTSGREGSKTMDSVPGGNLTLDNVSRKQMGAYLCIASNKVPPSVSKRIIVNVNFSPVVKADNQLIGSPIGTDVEIQCHVEAFPRAVNYWERDNGEMLLNGRKYQLEEVVESYRVTMKLIIRSFTKGDEGQYKCISTNSLGKAETSIRLYEIEVATPRATTEHQYHVYLTTPHSKSVNSLDLRRREGGGHSRQLEGVAGTGGSEGATAGLGVDFDRGGEQQQQQGGRQRQRQRLELGEGRTEGGGGGYLGGSKFGPSGDQHENHGSSTSRIEPRGCCCWLARWGVLTVLMSLRILFLREGLWLL